MKSDLYAVIKNPYGGWSVKEQQSSGIIATFPTKEAAEEYLRKRSASEVYETPVTIDIAEDSHDIAGDSQSDTNK